MNRRQRRASAKLRAPSNRPSAAALLQQGVQHQVARRFAEAEASYRQVLRLQPVHADALHLLGVICHATGRYDEAVDLIRRAIRQNGRNAAYHSDLGALLYEQGKPGEAEVACRNAIAVDPEHAAAWSNLGSALRALGRREDSAAACRRAVAIKPDYAEAYSNLGNALIDQGLLEDAIGAFRESIRIDPGYAQAWSNLGSALHSLGRLDDAIAAHRQAIALKPGLAVAHSNLAVALTARGRLSEGRAALEEAVRLAPRVAKYRCNLATVAPGGGGDANRAAMEEMLRDGALSPDDAIELHFALGKAHEDLGRHADAFRCWREGNALKRRRIAYDEAVIHDAFELIRGTFSADFIQARQGGGDPTAVPVFIVGMPRSGTTLVEQIVASHPDVFGAGELKLFTRAINDIRSTLAPAPVFPELAAHMAGEQLRALGTHYLTELQALAPASLRIVDKMPSNFLFAGLIHLALPHAVIIHTVRDPVDTCVSCFSILFAADQNHTYDLGELGRYYRRYRALMAHWHRVLPPGRILDVRYEHVVADLEGQARRILAHCGLDWDPACLAFHRTERAVRTASATQVRQPIYRNAIGRWRAYAPFLAPLLAELAHADDGG